MRFFLIAAALVGLTACNTTVPDSGSGVGFGNYDEYLAEKRAREAELAQSAVPPAGVISPESNSATPSGIAAETQTVLNQTKPSGSDGNIVETKPNTPAPQTVSTTTGISSENDFEAVGAERSIESDAELIARNREQYKVIAPEALPTRAGNTGPNVVEYALSTKHPRGTKVYSRVGIGKSARYARNCAKYASPDKAQADFLAKGGPNRDRLGLDPDGDGYACTWDPAPFRKALRG